MNKNTLFLFVLVFISLQISAKDNNSTVLPLTEKETAWLNKHSSISIGIMNDWPPMDFIDSYGKPEGIGVDFIGLINKRLDNRLQIVPGPWKQILTKAHQNQLYALMDITPTKEREEFFLFTKPYVSVPHVIISLRDQIYHEKIKDLRGKTLAVERGYYLINYIKDSFPSIGIIEYKTTADALDAVTKGSADAYIGNRAVAAYIMQTQLISNLEIEGKVTETASINSIGVRKDYPLLHSILEKVLASIPKEEKLAIFRKWAAAQNKEEIQLTETEKLWIEQHPVVRVAHDIMWAPIEFEDENGKFKGISKDFLNKISALTGLRFEIEPGLSWEETVKKVKTRKLDMYSAVMKTAKRMEYTLFTDSYFILDNFIFVKRDKPHIQQMVHLKGKKVASVKGYATTEFLKTKHPAIELIEVDNIRIALNKLAANEVDAYIDSLLTTSYAIQKFGLADIKVAGTTEFKYKMHMAVRKDWPILRSILDKALKSISYEERSRIFRKWNTVTVQHGFDYSLLWKTLIPLALFIAILMLWILKMNEEIRKRKQVEHELMIAKEEAEIANKTKSIFLSNMSHEIRTPMNAILGFSEFLHEKETDPQKKDFLSSILVSGKTLLTLINDILDLSKVEAGKLELNYENISLQNIFEDMKRVFSQKVAAKNLKFTTHIAPDFPATIVLDEVRIRQILINLLSNAIKFTERGFITLSSATKNSNQLILEVEDSGIGIAPENVQKIFDLFEQAYDKKNKNFGGTGLGLAITKKLVELMNGTINVVSTVNKGTKFTVTFDHITFNYEVHQTAKENTEIIDPFSLQFEKKNVLIADDIKENRNFLKSILNDFGFSTIECTNGKEAIEKTKEHSPDIIIMDLKMPEMDGYEATQILKNDPELQHIPVIVITASAIKHQEDALKEITDSFLQKPVSVHSLISEFTKFLPYKKLYTETQPKNLETKQIFSLSSITTNLTLFAEIKQMKDTIKELQNNMVINDIAGFAEKMNTLAKIENCTNLIQWSENLQRAASRFEIDEIKKMLHDLLLLLK